MGHEVGSNLLRNVGDILRSTFRGGDILSRIGGDEFAIIFDGTIAECAIAITRLDEITKTKNDRDGNPYIISISAGKFLIDPGTNVLLSQMISAADAAMYEQKQRKRTAGTSGSGASGENERR